MEQHSQGTWAYKRVSSDSDRLGADVTTKSLTESGPGGDVGRKITGDAVPDASDGDLGHSGADEVGGQGSKFSSERGKKVEQKAQPASLFIVKRTRGKMADFVASSPRDPEKEGLPFSEEFSKLLVSLSTSYYLVDVDFYSVEDILEYRRVVARDLCDSGCITKLCDLLSDALKKRDFVSESGAMVKGRWSPIEDMAVILLNYSNVSEAVRIAIGRHPCLLEELTRLVLDWRPAHLDDTLTDEQNKLVRQGVGILHNCGQQEENVAILRDLDLINILLPYVNSPREEIRLSSISTLADIVNEEEAELLQTNTAIFEFIVKKLRRALRNKERTDLGWSVVELTRALKGLARNDGNKKILVEEGCLPLLIQELETGSDEERSEAANCLWALSFDEVNKTKMATEPGLVGIVQALYTKETGQLHHSCHGILWSLREELLKSERHKALGAEISHVESKATMKAGVEPVTGAPGEAKVTRKGHVMVSYQWGHQEVIKKIVHELRSYGIPVWLDIDYMGGSTIEAMAKAVEDSSTVVMAMSQKYKDSPNCRAEAEYAFQKRKQIIPLVMQAGYKADGWLGFILGAKLYYDFSGKHSFQESMSGLLKEVKPATFVEKDVADGSPIVEKPLTAKHADRLEATPTSHHAPPLPAPLSKSKEAAILSWDQKDKRKWLRPHHMDTSSVADLSGEEIVFLYKLKSELWYTQLLIALTTLTAIVTVMKFPIARTASATATIAFTTLTACQLVTVAKFPIARAATAIATISYTSIAHPIRLVSFTAARVRPIATTTTTVTAPTMTMTTTMTITDLAE